MKTKPIFNSFALYIYLLLISLGTKAQPGEKLVKIKITPDHSDWTYHKGEIAKFKVSITKNNVLLPNVKIRYEVGPELVTPFIKDSTISKDGNFSIEGYTLKQPGFLRCKVTAEFEDNKYEGLATAAYDPELIKPTTEYPSDFNEFWDKAKSDLAKVPLDIKLTLLPDRCTELTNVYHANIQNFRIGVRLYGIVSIPKKPGKYPAVLRVPGAGVRPYYGDVSIADLGVITFEIGIHGIPVTMDPSVYVAIKESILDGYPFIHLDDKDKYYYKRVYLGCVRAVDFLYSLPEFDGNNIGVIGGSQGGALAIVTAALDNRIKCLVSFYPALSDLTGYLNNRAGGWPHMFKDQKARKEQIETTKYYDVVNFAKNLKVPGYYSWGFNDVVCAPTSIYSAYNSINAPKESLIIQETGHWTYPEQNEKTKQWLMKKLNVNTPK